MKNLIGQVFGELLVLEELPKKGNHRKFLCQSLRTKQKGEVWYDGLISGTSTTARNFPIMPLEECDSLEHHLLQMEWCDKKLGYKMARFGGKAWDRHVYIWNILYGAVPEGYIIDHVNRIPGDDRPENLRILTPSQSNLNKRKHSNSTSKYKGVSFHKRTKKWLFDCKYDGVRKSAYFETESEAAFAYNIYMTYHAPRELVLEHDLPGNLAGRFIPILNEIK